jgi:putative iron-only hydrogenase system regulator
MKRIATLGIIVENLDNTEQINGVLHKYGEIIVGRMGLPLKEYAVSVITVCVVGEETEISALSGALGRIEGVSVKASFSKKEIN